MEHILRGLPRLS